MEGGGGCPDFNNATDTDKLPTHCATTASLLSIYLSAVPIDSQCEVWHMPTDASTDHLHVLCGDYLI